MPSVVKTFDGETFGIQRIKGRPRRSSLRAGHSIGVLPDGRELVEFNGEWFWLLHGASSPEILLVEKLLREQKHGA